MAMYYWICPNCEISVHEDYLYCSCGYTTTKDEIDKNKISLQELLKIVEKRKERENNDASESKGTGPKINYRLLVKCTSCSQYISKRANACPKCGSTQTKVCSICLCQIPTDSSSCPECGDPAPFGEYQTSLINNTDPHDTANPEEDIKKKGYRCENNTREANYYSISSA